MKSSPSVGTACPTPAKTTPNVPILTSKNSRSIKLEETNSDDTIKELKYYESEMKMEISPKKMIVSPDAPLQVSIKCVAKNLQELIVQLDSFLFVILNPRASRGTKSQISCFMSPGETMNFEIGMMKKKGPGVHGVPAFEKPEGKLTIFHQVASSVKDDADEESVSEEMNWQVTEISLEGYPPKPYGRPTENIVKIEVNHYRKHGISEQEMFLEQETEGTKKRRE